MRKKSLLSLLFLLLAFTSGMFTAGAQEPMKGKSSIGEREQLKNACASDMMLELLRKDKNFRQQEDRMNRQILNASRQLADDTLTLPVVIHIVNPNPFAISDAFVIAGINDLNDAFSKAGAYAPGAGVDTKIRFCIAKTDPEGGITTGITRTTSYYGSDLNMDIEDGPLKNQIQWDPSRYINIWLINNIEAESYANYSCGVWTRLRVGGYATMPPGGTSLDGIVVTGFKQLLAHEMGHYLGLYHTFEGGCFNNDCTVNGDRVCDTPPDGSLGASASCSSPDNSCFTDTLSSYSNGNFPVDVPDQVSNFMDYSNGACSNQFTQGQADRMRAAIQTQRAGLLVNQCAPPCSEAIVANFLRDTAYTVAGETVNFTNTSTGATNYSWLVDGVVVAATANYSHTFPAIGKYKITLKAFNADANCFASYTTYVIVNCGVTARFFTNKKAIASELPLYPDSVIFKNVSFRGVSFQWLISNSVGMAEQVVSTNNDLVYVFPVPGTYRIRLVATNGSCVDTSGTYVVLVQDPDADVAVFLFNAYCFQQTKVKVSFCLDNYGYASVPPGTPVTFYDKDPRQPGATKLSPTFYQPFETKGGNCRYCFFDHTLNIPYAGLNQLYAVFNDSGNTAPLALPNRSFPELNYVNNVSSISGFKFSVTATPPSATLLPGDTLQLSAQATPFPVPGSTYLWSDAAKLSCTSCRQPFLYADSDRVKMVIATSQFGCKDTAYIDIKVPPANDYTINLNNLVCASKDSMLVDFTLFNKFFRGVIPKNLRVSFYNGNPFSAGATLLLPVFAVPDTTFALEQNFTTRLKLIPEGKLYAVVNDSSLVVPVSLPNTLFLEKDYSNNGHSIDYMITRSTIDTSICQGTNYDGYTQAGKYVDTLKTLIGCDSIRTLNLTVRPIFSTTITTAICAGESYEGYSSSGTYIDVFTSMNGCDSTRTLQLTVKPIYNTSIDKVICQGEQYAGHGVSGLYVEKFTAANGCDSTRTLTLLVNPTKLLTMDPEICEGESFFAAGKLQTLPGTYRDTFQTYLGCDSIKITNLTVHLNPRPRLGTDRGICTGGDYTLDPGNFSSYLWQDGSTASTFTTAITGKYFVRVLNEFGCRGADTINLDRFLPLPANFLPADTSLCNGNVLTVKLPGYKTYTWSTGATNSSIDITQNGIYRLTVTDQFDCTGTDSLQVSFTTDCILVGIPNAFSPNNDGRNETFKPYFPAPVTGYTMQIFNRLGQLVFETHQPGEGWDGTFKGAAQDPATFVYSVFFTDFRGAKEKRRGTVVLIR
ncbi:MAG: M43 family zinc metalloprotease [Bacteroidota bacterium]